MAQCAPRSSNGPDHLGLCAFQIGNIVTTRSNNDEVLKMALAEKANGNPQVRRRLCHVFPLPARLRQRLCFCVFPLPAWLRQVSFLAVPVNVNSQSTQQIYCQNLALITLGLSLAG